MLIQSFQEEDKRNMPVSESDALRISSVECFRPVRQHSYDSDPIPRPITLKCQATWTNRIPALLHFS